MNNNYQHAMTIARAIKEHWLEEKNLNNEEKLWILTDIADNLRDKNKYVAWALEEIIEEYAETFELE